MAAAFHVDIDTAVYVSCKQVDAMSDAVDNAEVMLSCINLLYKESASECPSTVARLSLVSGVLS